jgi:hypothetical protein
MGCCQTKGRALQYHTLCKALVQNRTGVHRGGLKYAKSRENWSKEQDASVKIPASEHRTLAQNVKYVYTYHLETYLALQTMACLQNILFSEDSVQETRR